MQSKHTFVQCPHEHMVLLIHVVMAGYQDTGVPVWGCSQRVISAHSEGGATSHRRWPSAAPTRFCRHSVLLSAAECEAWFYISVHSGVCGMLPVRKCFVAECSTSWKIRTHDAFVCCLLLNCANVNRNIIYCNVNGLSWSAIAREENVSYRLLDAFLIIVF